MEEVLNCFSLAFFLGHVLNGNPLTSDCGLSLLLHFGFVTVQEILGSLLEEDVVITLPSAVDIASSKNLGKAAIEGISESTARFSTFMDAGVGCPGTDRFDHRNQSMEFCQLVVSWLEDFLLVL